MILTEKRKFFDFILKSLNEKLIKSAYFCGDKVTLADMTYYSEVSTVMLMLGEEIDEKEYP